MKMYTVDGQEVELVKKINEGYLARLVYCDDYDDEGLSEDDEFVDDDIHFFKNLYDNAPIEKYAKEVSELKIQTEKLKKQISELASKKRSEESLLNKVSKFPIVQQLVDYITGDFKFILYISNFEMKTKESVYNSPYVAMAHTINSGYCLYRLRNDSYPSYSDDIKFLVFKTKEETTDYSKKEILTRIKKYKSTYNASSNFKEMFDKIDRSCPAKSDPDVVSAYKDKLKELTEIENKEKEEKLNKEMEELLKKQQKLQEQLLAK